MFHLEEIFTKYAGCVIKCNAVKFCLGVGGLKMGGTKDKPKVVSHAKVKDIF